MFTPKQRTAPGYRAGILYTITTPNGITASLAASTDQAAAWLAEHGTAHDVRAEHLNRLPVWLASQQKKRDNPTQQQIRQQMETRKAELHRGGIRSATGPEADLITRQQPHPTP